MKITKMINQEIEKIFNLKNAKSLSSVDKIITEYLIEQWNAKNKLLSLKEIAAWLHISESSISKYLLKNKMEKFLVLQYLYKLNAASPGNENALLNQNIEKIARKIKNSKKVIFLGQGNSGLLAKQFYTLLVLKNIYAVYLEGKPDQMKLLKNYQEGQFLIVISHSFNHNWCSQIIKSNKHALIITSNQVKVRNHQFLLHTHDPNNLKSEKITSFHLNLINEYMQKIIDMI